MSEINKFVLGRELSSFDQHFNYPIHRQYDIQQNQENVEGLDCSDGLATDLAVDGSDVILAEFNGPKLVPLGRRSTRDAVSGVASLSLVERPYRETQFPDLPPYLVRYLTLREVEQQNAGEVVYQRALCSLKDAISSRGAEFLLDNEEFLSVKIPLEALGKVGLEPYGEFLLEAFGKGEFLHGLQRQGLEDRINWRVELLGGAARSVCSYVNDNLDLVVRNRDGGLVVDEGHEVVFVFSFVHPPILDSEDNVVVYFLPSLTAYETSGADYSSAASVNSAQERQRCLVERFFQDNQHLVSGYDPIFDKLRSY